MDQDGDEVSMDYEENILMFEWFYIIPYSVCNPGKTRTCPGADNELNPDVEYLDRFRTYNFVNAEGSSVGTNYAMCDIYCSFDHEQRNASGYVYDVTTDIPDNFSNFSTPINELLFFFVRNNAGLV